MLGQPLVLDCNCQLSTWNQAAACSPPPAACPLLRCCDVAERRQRRQRADSLGPRRQRQLYCRGPRGRCSRTGRLNNPNRHRTGDRRGSSTPSATAGPQPRPVQRRLLGGPLPKVNPTEVREGRRAVLGRRRQRREHSVRSAYRYLEPRILHSGVHTVTLTSSTAFKLTIVTSHSPSAARTCVLLARNLDLRTLVAALVLTIPFGIIGK